MRTIRLFVSSPSDVDHERRRIEHVAERLNGEFAGVARVETIRWETAFYSAHATFQAQIPEAADCDIVVAVFWARLGSELPPEFPRMPDGEPYPSGTAYEVLSAIRVRESRPFPDIYVFRKTEKRLLAIDDEAELAQARAQWSRLEAFFQRWFKSSQGHFLAAFQSFKTTDEFEDALEALLRQWVEKHVLQGRSVLWPIETKGSPFRGLAAFDAEHAPVFFGRTRDTGRAIDRLKEAAEHGTPFLLVIGASGAGKSSLVRAGIVPRLTAPGVVRGVDFWRVAVLRPDAGPSLVDALTSALYGGAGSEDEKSRTQALPELAEGDCKTPSELTALLRSGDEAAIRPIVRALDRIAAVEHERRGFERPLRTDLLLVVDQLDDLFATSVTDDDRTVFAKLLRALAATGRVWIVTTLRAALYESFLGLPDLKALKDTGSDYDLAPPGPAELTEIVRKPAEATGLVYERDAAGEMLDERLLRDAGGADTLPLLQFTLQRLFEERQTTGDETRLTFSAYSALGGIDGAIDQAAERAIKDLTQKEITALPRLLRQLAVPVHDVSGVTASHTALTIRAVALDTVVAGPDAPRLVNALVDARILLLGQENNVATVRLAHQRVLESWKRAKGGTRANADFYRIRSDVLSDFRRWIESGGHSSTLIPRGRPLSEGRELIYKFGKELRPELRHFINASRCRQAMVAINIFALPVFFLMLVIEIFMRNAQVIQSENAYLPLLFWLLLVWPILVCAAYWGFRHFASQLVTVARSMDRQIKIPRNQLRQRLHLITANAIFASTIPIFSSSLFVTTLRLLWKQKNGYFWERPWFLILFVCLGIGWFIVAGLLRRRIRRAALVPPADDPDLTSESWTGPFKTLEFHPILVLLALALISGLLSRFAVPTFGAADWKSTILKPSFYSPPISFAFVVVFGESAWRGRGISAAITIVLTVVFAWCSAYTVAHLIVGILGPIKSLNDLEKTIRVFWAVGAVAGGIGAGLTALAIPTIRQSNGRMIGIVLIGAVAGTLLFSPNEYLLYMVWQGSFAAYLGYWYGKSQSKIPRVQHHEIPQKFA